MAETERPVVVEVPQCICGVWMLAEVEPSQYLEPPDARPVWRCPRADCGWVKDRSG